MIALMSGKSLMPIYGLITYKAQLAGIEVRYVNPYNTSKKCPKCGRINKPKDRTYQCKCGYHGHRDVVAAINILHAL